MFDLQQNFLLVFLSNFFTKMKNLQYFIKRTDKQVNDFPGAFIVEDFLLD